MILKERNVQNSTLAIFDQFLEENIWPFLLVFKQNAALRTDDDITKNMEVYDTKGLQLTIYYSSICVSLIVLKCALVMPD